MKFLALALTVLAAAFSLRADEVLQNPDFTDGSNHWQGDGKILADFARDNPGAATFPGKGLLIQLKPDRWTKIVQDFKGNKDTHYCLTVTYRYSQALAFSAKPEDYTNIPKQVRFEDSEHWTPFDIPAGQFFVTVDDIGSPKGYWEKVTSTFGSIETQKYVDPGLPMDPNVNKMVTVAFPPGTGTVLVVSISVMSSP